MALPIEDIENDDWRDLASVIFSREMLKGEPPLKTLSKLAKIVVFMVIWLPNYELAIEEYLSALCNTINDYMAEPDSYEIDLDYIFDRAKKLADIALSEGVKKSERKKRRWWFLR